MRSNIAMQRRITIIASLAYAFISCLPIPLTAQNADAEFERQMEAEARALANTKPIHFVSLLFLRNPTVEGSQYGRAISHFYASEEKEFRINAYAGSISRSIRYDGPREFILFDKQVTEKGEDIRISKLNIDLGSPGPKILVLTTNSDDNLIGWVIPTDKRKFPENVVRVFNFSAQPVKVKVQETAKDLSKMSMEDFSVQMDQTRAMVGFTVAAYANGNGYLVARKRIGMAQDTRKLIVLFPNPTKPEELTFTNLTIDSGPFLKNYSDKEITAGDSKYQDSYIPAAQR